MIDNTAYNVLIKALRQSLKDKDIQLIRERALMAHELIHDKKLTGNIEDTFENKNLAGLNEQSFRYTTSKKYQGYRTLAFFIFHMTRIEDICANTLLADKEQVIFQDEWVERLHINRIDTGNSMSLTEMQVFSEAINQDALFDYRLAVAKRTRTIIKELDFEAIKRKPTKQQLAFLLNSGSVCNHPDAIWLLDFWAKKNGGGLLLMPITRHQKVHLSDCAAIIKSTK